jgi:hypothetical protein
MKSSHVGPALLLNLAPGRAADHRGCHKNRAPRRAWPQMVLTPSAASTNRQVTTLI